MATQPNPVRLPVREIGLLVYLCTASYVLLAMISYSPVDPSWNFTGSVNGRIENLVGVSGAWAADALLFGFGWVAYLLPAALVFAAIRMVRSSGVGIGRMVALVRTLGWLGVLVSACALASLHFAPAGDLPGVAGGVLGAWLAAEGVPVFGWIGLTLIAGTGLAIGAQAALGFSWLHIAEVTGYWIHRAIDAALRVVDRYLDLIRTRRAALKETRANRESRKRAVVQEKQKRRTRKQPAIAREVPEAPRETARQVPLFKPTGTGDMPDLELLDAPRDEDQGGYSEASLTAISRLLELKLADFGVEAEVVSVLPGPVVTRFEVQPAAGVKVQKISSLAKDLARSLAVISVRIVEVIPGKSVVGIEIPNEDREVVRLKEILAADEYQHSHSPLTLALGKDIAGDAVAVDVSGMPHLLVAGTTGSGKSVGVNAMLLSILYKSTPDEVRLILVDPKMLELSIYEGIPHLLTPVVTDMKDAAQALNWCVAEMERRYRLMAALGVRNMAGFNKQVRAAATKGGIADPLWPAESDDEAPLLEPLPYIVVVIDEFADMMMIVGKKVEQLIARIAQKARAAGIHLILATQRPSVDVITGLIKANIPTRISFQVSSKVDSRTILDQGGAEQLLGHGDMLYLPPGTAVPVRVHGAFVSDDEVHRVVSDWKERGAPEYNDDVITGGAGEPFIALEDKTGDTEQDDALYDEAVEFVLQSRRASISSVQRKLRIGYNRAARLIEAMEAAGVVSEMNTNGSREVLVPNRD